MLDLGSKSSAFATARRCRRRETRAASGPADVEQGADVLAACATVEALVLVVVDRDLLAGMEPVAPEAVAQDPSVGRASLF
jgi:hypothetical protein